MQIIILWQSRMFNFAQFLNNPEVNFSVHLRCFSAPFFQKYDRVKVNELNYGGKILLPNSCLDTLIRRNIQYPMLFKLTNLDPEFQKSTHAGVLEFLAEEGRCYLPNWMLNQMHLDEGGLISVEYRSLPPATYAKFKPMSTDFYNVTNPKAMLEVELRKFACLTKSDIIAVLYNEQVFEFCVKELKPQNAVTIIECDINIEFDAAEGYVEPKSIRKGEQEGSGGKTNSTNETTSGEEIANIGWKPFSGSGYRLDGKKARNSGLTSTAGQSKMGNERKLNSSTESNSNKGQGQQRSTQIVVDENYEPGQLTFVRTGYKNKALLEKKARERENDKINGVDPFSGTGRTLK